MKHGTHWNFTNATGVDNWTLVKTATFSKRASGEVLLRVSLTKAAYGDGSKVLLALKVVSDKGLEYEIPYQEYGYTFALNVIATIEVSDVLWLKVYVKNNSIAAGGVSGLATLDNAGLWFDREVNDISWV